MGKGSFSGIELSGFDFELLRLSEIRQHRIDVLKSMGYEVAKIDGRWYYRLKAYGSDHKWTPMDSDRSGRSDR